MTLTLTPHSWRTQLYHHLVEVGSVDLKTYNFQSTLRSIDCLIGFWTEQRGDGDAFWRTHIDGWKKWQLPHPLITWKIYQQRRGDAYLRTEINGDKEGPCLFQIPYINIHLLIDWSIFWLVGRTKRAEGHISTTAEIRKHYLTDLSTERLISLLMDTNQEMTKTGPVYFQSETSIFTYWSIDKSNDLSKDRKNGQRDTLVVQQT